MTKQTLCSCAILSLFSEVTNQPKRPMWDPRQLSGGSCNKRTFRLCWKKKRSMCCLRCQYCKKTKRHLKKKSDAGEFNKIKNKIPNWYREKKFSEKDVNLQIPFTFPKTCNYFFLSPSVQIVWWNQQRLIKNLTKFFGPLKFTKFTFLGRKTCTSRSLEKTARFFATLEMLYFPVAKKIAKQKCWEGLLLRAFTCNAAWRRNKDGKISRQMGYEIFWRPQG